MTLIPSIPAKPIASQQKSKGPFDIPAELESQEALEWLGFTIEKSGKIWQSWCEHLEDCNPRLSVNLISFAQTLMELTAVDAAGPAEDWYAAFRAYGLGEYLISALMHEEFQDLRFTETALFWAKETITERYQYLQSRHRDLQDKDHEKNTDKAGTQSQHRQSLMWGSSSVFYHTDSCDGKCTVPGFKYYWRATTKSQAAKMHRTAEKGKFNLWSIYSSAASEFGPQLRYHFTKQRETAQKYARYLQRRVYPEETVLVRLQVPQDTIKTLFRTLDLRESEKWLKLIWYCKGRPYELQPPELADIDGADLIRAPIFKATNRSIASLQHWEDIDRRDVLGLTRDIYEKCCDQYIFNRKVAEWLGQNLSADALTFHHCIEPDFEVSVHNAVWSPTDRELLPLYLDAWYRRAEI